MLSESEQNRYSRQITLGNFGNDAQLKLKNAQVLVVGAGALGCPVLSYLVAAGVGKIGIIDGDEIELSNLHRQVLYTTNDIGKKKADVAKKRLMEMNSETKIVSIIDYLNSENASEISKEYDIIVDGTDNFPTRYLVNDLCVLTDKVNVHGSILKFSGQVSVFNYKDKNGVIGPNYRDLYPSPPNPNDVVSCEEGGVIGALPGIVGSAMAMECIKVIAGIGEVFSGRFWEYDALNGSSQIFKFLKDETNPISGENSTIFNLIDYNEFCGAPKKSQNANNNKMKSINVAELKAMQDSNEDFQLIDVRETFEFDEVNMNGELIPLGEIPTRFSEISKDKKVVVHCKMGGRSANAIGFLEQNHGFDNLYNLEGGITSWLAES